jgi:hypothetical protein
MSQRETVLYRPGRFSRMRQRMKARLHVGDDLASFSCAGLRHMAGDLAITEADLQLLASHAADNTPLMEGMMCAHGLDPAVVRCEVGTLLRDVERVCTRCLRATRCRRELEAGTAAQHCHEYCLNAGTFDDLVAVRTVR